MTPAALFHRACVALFGEQYRAQMAKALKLRRVETVDDWASGRSEIPAGVWGDLNELVDERYFEMLDVRGAVREMAAELPVTPKRGGMPDVTGMIAKVFPWWQRPWRAAYDPDHPGAPAYRIRPTPPGARGAIALWMPGCTNAEQAAAAFAWMRDRFNPAFEVPATDMVDIEAIGLRAGALKDPR